MNDRRRFWIGALLSLLLRASQTAPAGETGQVVDLWPGSPPDAIAGMGEEKVVMSPVLDHEQVEVTESTRMITNVSRPTLTILRPPTGSETGTAMLKDKDELSPWLSIPTGTPPIFLAHGGADIISDPAHSVVAYLALKRAGVPAELHIYATAAHDFGVRPSDHPCSTWTQSCAVWMRHQGLLKPRVTEP